MPDPRDERVSVTCEAIASEACMGTHLISRRAEAKTRARNEGRYLCLPCSRRLKFSGRTNPSARHMHLDDGFLDVLDTEGKAYLLGWIASDGAIRKGTITLVVHDKDRVVLDTLIQITGAELPVFKKTEGQSGFSINSQRIVRAVCGHLGITPGRKSKTVRFPELAGDSLRWAFLRGYFDGDGYVAKPGLRTAPRCGIATTSPAMRAAILDFCRIPAYHNEAGGQLEWNGNAALDFLSRLYDGAPFYLPRKKNLYEDWCMWVPGLSGGAAYGEERLFRWVKTDPEARPPQKAHASDSGFDLTLLRAVRTHGPVTFFDTGVKIQPAFGWYFDLVPRSSITKTGYVLANSVGVIDRTYTGPVLVALLKVDPDAPDLELPARIVQIIPRPIVHIQWEEVESFDETLRGAGGFGSTGV
jgi:deoxyuridine 5'-triphosphate nucleotidohydrolase